jgi:hypothetical protein
MPYADAEARKRYQKTYKQKRRAMEKRAKAKINPLLLVTKIFFCQRFPDMFIPGAGGFCGGFLIARDEETINRVMRHELYGVHIFSLALDPFLPPEEDEDF